MTEAREQQSVVHEYRELLRSDKSTHVFYGSETLDAGETDGHAIKEGSFRGRGLVGAHLKLPPGYRGYVIEDKKSARTDGPSSWTATAMFDELTYWNHAARPVATDSQQRLMEWLPLAQQVCCQPL